VSCYLQIQTKFCSKQWFQKELKLYKYDEYQLLKIESVTLALVEAIVEVLTLIIGVGRKLIFC